jgi:hypothetical protein
MRTIHPIELSWAICLEILIIVVIKIIIVARIVSIIVASFSI